MVNRCICENVPFARIAELSREGVPLSQIAEKTGACTNCMMCRPYVYIAHSTQSSTVRLLTQDEIALIEERIGDQLPGQAKSKSRRGCA